MKFIDLFAGLGGFHLALRDLGHECVFASELNSVLQDLYETNFGMRPAGDIRAISDDEIPDHDILCAGFPCQPFSKAGEQVGLKDLERGSLFFKIMDIVRLRKPRFVILENVPNLRRHDKGVTWRTLEHAIAQEGYIVDDHRLSPHHFGIPQNRDRIFIVGDRQGLDDFSWPEASTHPTSIRTVLENNPLDARPLSQNVLAAMEMWQAFLDQFPSNLQLPSFPIWGMEFGADYPFEETTPFAMRTEQLWKHRGANGRRLEGLSRDEIMLSLPSYARTAQKQFPKWKKGFIRQNRELYEQHRNWLDEWRPQLLNFAPSFQKFEWNAKGEERDLTKHVLQIRASGLRVKRSTTAPSLIAMTTTQVPIIGWESRYMTIRECAKLQSIENIELPVVPTRAYAALGNAVNVEVVKLVARQLVNAREPKCSVEAARQSALKLENIDSPSNLASSNANLGIPRV